MRLFAIIFGLIRYAIHITFERILIYVLTAFLELVLETGSRIEYEWYPRFVAWKNSKRYRVPETPKPLVQKIVSNPAFKNTLRTIGVVRPGHHTHPAFGPDGKPNPLQMQEGEAIPKYVFQLVPLE